MDTTGQSLPKAIRPPLALMLSEPAHVGRLGRLDVLDAMAAPARRRWIDGGGFLVRVERHADRAVTNRVDGDLPAAPVHRRDDPLECLGREVRLAARRPVGVRREHGRRVRLDDAIGHQLHGARLEERIVGVLRADGVELVRSRLRELRPDRQRGVHA
jgi:hypothetical protein